MEDIENIDKISLDVLNDTTIIIMDNDILNSDIIISDEMETGAQANSGTVENGEEESVENTIKIINSVTDDVIDQKEAEVTENTLQSLENTPNKRDNVRKRIRREQMWKCNERKRKHQAGEAYISRRKKLVPAKCVVTKKDCLNSCKFKCSNQIPMHMREELLKSYCTLTQNEKHLYLTRVTKRVTKKRSTIQNATDENVSRRQYSYIYHFPVGGELIRVCKAFFLGTLAISQKPVYNAHSSKDANDIPKKDQRGKSGASQRRLPQDRLNDVITHIKLFPVVDSHYCRRRTKRQYLETNLSVPKLYDLYITWCQEHEKPPVKLSMYRRIFVTKFNYGFFMPKSDRCEKCEKYKIRKSENSTSAEEESTHQSHLVEKKAMRVQKDKDKKNSETPILVFDLENVVTCPRVDVGKFFYLQKLCVYNLTAYLTTTKTVYCVIWNESQQGRKGNCLASAFKKIIERVLEDNHIENLITWSDSCVPQNRNSYIAFAVLETLRQHVDLQSLVMNYSIAGHGAVQEVDAVHSTIEKFMKNAEFFSPLGFIKNLEQVNKKQPYVILQMKDTDFKNYEECASHFDYKKIPFTKVTSLKFTKELNVVSYKTSHSQENYVTEIILQREAETNTEPRSSLRILCEQGRGRGCESGYYGGVRTRGICHGRGRRRVRDGHGSVRTRGGKRNSRASLNYTAALQVIPQVMPKDKVVSKEKLESIQKMMPSMPEIDRQYFKALLHLN